jgi:uncharacterized protein (DUF4415 family)
MMKRGKIARYTSEELAAMRQAGKSRTDWARVTTMRDEDIGKGYQARINAVFRACMEAQKARSDTRP